MRTNSCHHPLRRLSIAILAVAAALSLGAPARSDDRGLLHATQQNPYVFIILDTSGSMHQSVACSPADIAAGETCSLCVPGDCLPHLMGDDPDSKIYVAKKSIYNIMAQHPNISFGFGHFDQSQVRVIWKYWWYSVAAANPVIKLDSQQQFPQAGQLEIFGQQAWACTDGGFGGTAFNLIGCSAAHPAHLDNAWEFERARRYPKLGDDNSKTWSYYFQETTGGGGPIYRATFTPVAGQTLGTATMQVKIAVDRCTNVSCSTTVNKGTNVMTFSLANQTVYWDTPVELNGTNIPDANGNGGNFYGGNPWTAHEVIANYSNANHQLELNTTDDTTLDPWLLACKTAGLCDLEQTATKDVLNRSPANTFSIGDTIPLDWTTNQQALIQQRMAPNPALGPNLMFGIAPYMADHPVAPEAALELINTAQRPLVPEGGTPTGNVMMSFANLMTGSTWPGAKFNPQALGTGSSWIGTASATNGDLFFSCKPTYVLLLTDGLASSDDGDWTLDKTACPNYAAWNKVINPAPGFACCAAEALRSITYGSAKVPYPIRTYVIGLGLSTTQVGGYNNTLQCIADEGGTGFRHFIKGDPNTDPVPQKGFPVSDPPHPGFCCSDQDVIDNPAVCPKANPCDGPGFFPASSAKDVAAALQTVLNLIQSQTTAFASAAVPSIQSNVENKSIITSFLPINQPIWPGRVDAYIDPVPTQKITVTLPDGSLAPATVPDPSQQCTAPGQQACHLWNAGDQILAQGLLGFDTAGSDATKRRIYYAPLAPTVITPNQRRLFLQMPPANDGTGQLFDLENALGVCGPGYSFYPPSSESFLFNATAPETNPCVSPQTTSTTEYKTAKQAVDFTEVIKFYQDATNQQVQYLLGDIFHSDPQVVGQPVNVTLFDGNVDGYQSFANAERFRRKALYFGSDDGELHAIDAGTVQLGKVAEHQTWVFNNGTGNEIFAFVPRTVMPTLNQLAIVNAAGGGGETFMVDGPPHIAEGFFDATGGTTPQWHSVVIGGLREGGRGYYAVDITQPDTLTSESLFPDCNSPKTPPDPTCSSNVSVQVPNPGASNYLPNCLNGGAGCGQLPYPTPLWEFTDSVKVSPACSGSGCQVKPNDEDTTAPGLNQPDLGQTWSRPNSGRVRICDTSACATFHEQWVVVFGGGMDPNAVNSQGNWLYMLDMATGSILYKRQLNGSVPSEPAAVDTGQDGFIDTLYIGTTAGHLYKVDLSQAAPIDSVTNRVSTSFWKPFEIFDTEGRQMFYPPAVFFDTDLNQYGISWGTGDRQDLWKCAGSPSPCLPGSTDLLSGRFYVMLDRDTTSALAQALTPATPGLPFKASKLQALTPDGALSGSAKNFLLSPGSNLQPGWYLDLKGGERVVNEAFALSGLLIFSSYQPQVIVPVSSSTVCANTGDTRVFVLNVTNGDPISNQVGLEGTPGVILPNGPGGTPTNRYFVLKDDFGLNINTSESTPMIATKGNPNPQQPPAPSPALKDVMAQIKLLMPSNCRFTAKRVNITVTDTFNAQFPVGAVPGCTIEKNWKEF